MRLDPEPGYLLRLITVPFAAILLVLLVLDRSGKLLAWHISRRRLKNKALADKT